MESQSEEEFLAKIKADEKIIHKVIGLYVDHPEDRRDLYQEILLQAWRSYKSFRGRSKFSTWLYKVSLNTVLSFRKKKRPIEELDESRIDGQLEPQARKENHEILYYLIKQLNEVDRMLMTLHLDGYSNPEVAEITGMSQNNVGVKIHRLKTKIVDQFKKYTNGYS